MPIRQTISVRDLELLADISDPSRLREAGDPLPLSVLRDLVTLVPCDSAEFLAYDAHTHTHLEVQRATEDVEGVTLAAKPEEIDAFFWENFWTWPASHPERTGDYSTLIRDVDYSVPRRAAGTKAEFHRLVDCRHALVVPLSPRGPVSHRIIL